MDNIKREIKRLVNVLRDNGVSEKEIRKLFEVEKPLSRLMVTKDLRIVLLDLECLEVKMRPLYKAVYLLFLRHPEGIRFKELPDYREELANIYHSMKQSTQARHRIEKSISDVTDQLNHSIVEKSARIKEAFLKVMDAESARNYTITGARGEAKRITLDRNLVVWEKESPPNE